MGEISLEGFLLLCLNDAARRMKAKTLMYFADNEICENATVYVLPSLSLFVCECPVSSIRGMQDFHKHRLFGPTPLSVTDRVSDLENADPLCRTTLYHSLQLVVINTCICVNSAYGESFPYSLVFRKSEEKKYLA